MRGFYLIPLYIIMFIFPAHYGLVFTHGNAEAKNDPMNSLIQRPHEENLTMFKLYCKEDNPINYQSQPRPHQLVEKAVRTGNINLIRAMIFSLGRCAQGKSFGHAREILSNEILLKHPKNLIEALYEEHNPSFGIIKDEKGTKTATLSKVKLKESREAIRERLLESLEAPPK